MAEKINLHRKMVIGIGIAIIVLVAAMIIFAMTFFNRNDVIIVTPKPTATPVQTPTLTPTPTTTPTLPPNAPEYVIVSGTVSFGARYDLPIYSIHFKSQTTGIDYVANMSGIDSANYSISLPNGDSYIISSYSALGETLNGNAWRFIQLKHQSLRITPQATNPIVFAYLKDSYSRKKNKRIIDKIIFG